MFLLLKHFLGNVPWGNGTMNKGKATISKTLESTLVIGSGWDKDALEEGTMKVRHGYVSVN